MEISAHHEYTADPATVHAMMTDPDWYAAVLDKSGADHHDVHVEGDSVSIHAEVSAPNQVQRFTGATLAIEQSFVWHQVAEGWDGVVEAKPARMPAKMTGTATIRPGGPGTIVEYAGDFTVSVPLLGGKLEKLAKPKVMSVIDLQQEVGNDWLAGKRA
ncbi:DUF2505 domain-containing protein [Propionibacterium sp.]|uniref:DUF2505 domain-containing protein n=1 Tax=Propionibacterium sp. TaxID=1977903 RepID=UPI0039E7BD7F